MENPGWDGVAVTPWGEAILLFSTLPALVLIVLTMLAIRFRHMWAGLIVVLLWSTLVTFLISLADDEVRNLAIDEGCRGDPVLFIGAAIVICIATLILTGPKRKPDTHGET